MKTNIDETLLEIREYDGEGYQPLIDFGEWRVAILRYLDDLQPDRINSMERHMQTDEVFVPLRGRGMLIIGGTGQRVGEINSQKMEMGKIYNIKREAWHTVLLSRDATILLVENRDTGKHNTEYTALSAKTLEVIQALAKGESF